MGFSLCSRWQGPTLGNWLVRTQTNKKVGTYINISWKETRGSKPPNNLELPYTATALVLKIKLY